MHQDFGLFVITCIKNHNLAQKMYFNLSDAEIMLEWNAINFLKSASCTNSLLSAISKEN